MVMLENIVLQYVKKNVIFKMCNHVLLNVKLHLQDFAEEMRAFTADLTVLKLLQKNVI